MATECAGECGTPLSGRQKKWCSSRCQKKATRDQWLQKIYGITLEEYNELFKAQGGVCAICRRPPNSNRSLAVDHEHSDGTRGPIRGLLCFFDNRRVVGRRSSQSIIAAAEYLKNPPAQVLWGERIAPGRPKKKRRPKKRSR